MNKNYKNKKRIAIIVLSALAVCLAACLVWYVGTMGKGKAELPPMEPEAPEAKAIVTVPEIDAGGIVEPEKEAGLGQETELAAGAGQEPAQQEGDQAEPEELPTEEPGGEEAAMVPTETPPARTDGKPQSPKAAVPPSEPPAEVGSTAAVENPDRDGNCQPEHVQPQEEQPQGGDTNPAGAVYVPGFGYIESSGPNEQGTSYTDGDWDRQIGSM